MHSDFPKVIFLDRDGVINRERGEFTWKLEDFKLIDDLFDSLKVLQDKGFKFVIISNQSGIARGLYKFSDVEFLHNLLSKAATAQGIEFLEIYYCPHHPEFSRCICRKPDSLLLEKAIARFNIDRTKSFFIGDADRDMAAAIKAGVQGIQVQSNSSLMQIATQISGT